MKAGRLRALALTSSARSDVFPNIPLMSEFLKDFEANTWFGIGAPARTPADVITRLNAEINAALAEPKLKARIASQGGLDGSSHIAN